ncbi:MAG: 4'-phosphopantetheinyl transferase family protein [Planctomycetota bacterium]
MEFQPDWKESAAFPEIAPHEIHLWRISQKGSPEALEELGALLSPEERRRAARFHRPADREAFLRRRGQVRRILGACLDRDPRSFRFRAGPQGKPALEAGPSTSRLRFNWSHSGDWALLAVGLDAEIGIDLERIRPLADLMALARRWFSPRECGQLEALPAGERLTAFFLCWTRKEALLKALGSGLSGRLDRFAVSLAPGEPARVLWTAEPFPGGLSWGLHALEAAPGYPAALASPLLRPRLLSHGTPCLAR